MFLRPKGRTAAPAAAKAMSAASRSKANAPEVSPAPPVPASSGDSAIRSRLPSSKSPWNRRSSDRSAASTAPTHNTPPATRARQFQIGAHAQRHQGRHQREESERERRTAARTRRQPHITQEKRGEGAVHAAPSLSVFAPRPKASWVAATRMPPLAQCAFIRSEASARPLESREAKGSSISQTSRPETISRARPRRFF